MTTEYRREAVRKRRGDSRLSDTGGFGVRTIFGPNVEIC